MINQFWFCYNHIMLSLSGHLDRFQWTFMRLQRMDNHLKTLLVPYICKLVMHNGELIHLNARSFAKGVPRGKLADILLILRGNKIWIYWSMRRNINGRIHYFLKCSLRNRVPIVYKRCLYTSILLLLDTNGKQLSRRTFCRKSCRSPVLVSIHCFKWPLNIIFYCVYMASKIW